MVPHSNIRNLGNFIPPHFVQRDTVHSNMGLDLVLDPDPSDDQLSLPTVILETFPLLSLQQKYR